MQLIPVIPVRNAQSEQFFLTQVAPIPNTVSGDREVQTGPLLTNTPMDLIALTMLAYPDYPATASFYEGGQPLNLTRLWVLKTRPDGTTELRHIQAVGDTRWRKPVVHTYQPVKERRSETYLMNCTCEHGHLSDFDDLTTELKYRLNGKFNGQTGHLELNAEVIDVPGSENRYAIVGFEVNPFARLIVG